MGPHEAAAVTDTTLQRYKQTAQTLSEYLEKEFSSVKDATDFDDALVEWKQASPVIQAAIEITVAALEFVFLDLRQMLVCARSLIRGW